MKNRTIISGFIFLSIFLINVASAMTVFAWFENNTNANSKTISEGESIVFNTYLVSGGKNPSSSAGLYSGTNLIYTFVSPEINNGKLYTITPEIYQEPGTYKIKIYGTDSFNSDYFELILIVEESSNENHAPDITSIPITNINESLIYNYQVTATDSDGDTLVYSLVSSPSWLSINSATGLITGTAPAVSSNTNYNLQVSVSDGEDSDSQSYTLTVVNINNNDENHAPDITSIPITNINESLIYNYQVTATDSDGDTLVYSLVSSPSWLSINSATGLITGTAPAVSSNTNYNLQVSVSDGEDSDSQSYTLTVVNINNNDENSPVIIITNPENGKKYNYNNHKLTFNITDENLDSCWYSINSGTTNHSITCNNEILLTAKEGGNIWIVYANDSFGNYANASVTFYVDTISPAITVVSPKEDETYDDEDMTVKVNISEEVQFVEITLIKESTILKKNMTKQTKNYFFEYNLKNLENGEYTLGFYTIDSFGNTATKSVNFEIELEQKKKKKSSSGFKNITEEFTSKPNYYNNETAKSIILNPQSEEDEKTCDYSYYILLFLLICFIIFITCKIIRELRK